MNSDYLASVLPLLAPGAEETLVQGEPGPEPRPPEIVLADAVGDDGHLDLLEHVLVVAAGEGVLAPARDEAPPPVEILEPVGQADRVDVGTAKEDT